MNDHVVIVSLINNVQTLFDFKLSALFYCDHLQKTNITIGATVMHFPMFSCIHDSFRGTQKLKRQIAIQPIAVGFFVADHDETNRRDGLDLDFVKRICDAEVGWQKIGWIAPAQLPWSKQLNDKYCFNKKK